MIMSKIRGKLITLSEKAFQASEYKHLNEKEQTFLKQIQQSLSKAHEYSQEITDEKDVRFIAENDLEHLNACYSDLIEQTKENDYSETRLASFHDTINQYIDRDKNKELYLEEASLLSKSFSSADYYGRSTHVHTSDIGSIKNKGIIEIANQNKDVIDFTEQFDKKCQTFSEDVSKYLNKMETPDLSNEEKEHWENRLVDYVNNQELLSTQKKTKKADKTNYYDHFNKLSEQGLKKADIKMGLGETRLESTDHEAIVSFAKDVAKSFKERSLQQEKQSQNDFLI